MKIQQAVPNDLIEVLYLLQACVNDMNEKGLKHWNNAYPGTDFMIKAIENKTLYLYKDNGIAKGMVVLSDDEPNEYKTIEWKGKADKVLFIRFLAVHPKWQDKGFAERLIEYAEGHSKDYGYSTMRVDIYSGISDGENLCINMGFTQTGQFQTEFQQTPYFAFEKSL